MEKNDDRKSGTYGERGERRERRERTEHSDRPSGERRTYQSRGPSWTRKPSGDGDRRGGERNFDKDGRGERRFDNDRGKPQYDRSGGDRPRYDGPRSDRPRYDGPRSDRPRYDGPRSDRPRFDGPRSDRPRFDGPRSDRPRSDRPYNSKPYGDKPRGDRPYSDRPRYGSGDGERRNDGERRFERRDGERGNYRRDSGGGRPSYPSSRPYGGERSNRGEGFERRDGCERRFERRDGGERRFDRRDAGERSFDRRDDRRVALKDRDVHRVKDAPIDGTPYRERYQEVELREDRLEGRNPVQEAIKAGRTIDKLWVQRSADGKIEPALMQLVYAVRDKSGVIIEAERPALDKMSQTHAHQGVIAQTAMHDYYEIEDVLAFAREKGEKPFIVLLDELQDAYNLGSILRIADAAGVHGVVFPKRRAIGLDAVVAKASAGAIEHVRCCRVNNLVQTIETLKKEGVWIVGTSMDGDVFYEGNRLTEPIALIIGSEGEGMRPLVEKHCDFKLSIPMMGKINSLNAAVAAGIIIFEAARQRLAAGVTQLQSEPEHEASDAEAETLDAFEREMNTPFETEVDASAALEVFSDAIKEVMKLTDSQADAEE